MAKKDLKKVAIVGGGLAGSECALQLNARGIAVDLYEMRDKVSTPVHKTNLLGELVCSNSLKSEKANSAAGLLKCELEVLHSYLYQIALNNRVKAGGALAVDRDMFAREITEAIHSAKNVNLIREEVVSLSNLDADAIVLATGPMTSEKLSCLIQDLTGENCLNFYDAAAPIVEAESIDYDIAFSSNRYEQDNQGDYLNCPFTRDEYETFTSELLNAKKVILKDFEQKELFNACQPIEEIARSSIDAPRFGPMKPVGLIDPRTGKRPWAVVQLRAENCNKTAYNLVGFQTNLTFEEQKRVFSLIPGLKGAEFARYGVMHKNIFINAPKLFSSTSLCSRLSESVGIPVYIAGQLAGTEGYVEAIRSGLHTSISVFAQLEDLVDFPLPPKTSVFGALIDWACSETTIDYQPMHVNFGILEPLETRVRNKKQRYEAYAKRAKSAIGDYISQLEDKGLLQK